MYPCPPFDDVTRATQRRRWRAKPRVLAARADGQPSRRSHQSVSGRHPRADGSSDPPRALTIGETEWVDSSPPSFAALSALPARTGRASPEVVRAARLAATPQDDETMKQDAPKTCAQRWRDAAVANVVVSHRGRLPSNAAATARAASGVEPTARPADTAGGSLGEISFEAGDVVFTTSRNTRGPGWGTRLAVRGGDGTAASWGLGVSSREGGAARRPGPWGLARRYAPSGVRVACDARTRPWGVPRLCCGTAGAGPV